MFITDAARTTMQLIVFSWRRPLSEATSLRRSGAAVCDLRVCVAAHGNAGATAQHRCIQACRTCRAFLFEVMGKSLASRGLFTLYPDRVLA